MEELNGNNRAVYFMMQQRPLVLRSTFSRRSKFLPQAPFIYYEWSKTQKPSITYTKIGKPISTF